MFFPFITLSTQTISHNTDTRHRQQIPASFSSVFNRKQSFTIERAAAASLNSFPPPDRTSTKAPHCPIELRCRAESRDQANQHQGVGVGDTHQLGPMVNQEAVKQG